MSFRLQPAAPARPNRCQLFAPGSRPAIFEKAAKSAAARWGRVRLLKAIDLAEISAVLRPAARGAEGTSVKSVEAEEGGATANEAIGVEGKSNENNDEGDRRDDPRLQTRQADALAALDDVIERWKDIDDLCLKEGRSISESRRKRLRSLRDDLAGGVKELDALLAETEPKPKDEGKTDDLWDLRAQAEMISVRHGTR